MTRRIHSDRTGKHRPPSPAGRWGLHLLLAGFLLGALAPAARGQTAGIVGDPVMLVPTGDTVLVYLLEQPPELGGFVVERAVPDGQYERLTASPVGGVRDPAAALALLGDAVGEVSTAVRAADEMEMLRRLRSDPFAGSVMSLLYREVADVLGRLYVDTTAVPGTTYDYRVVLTDADTAAEATYTARTTVRDIEPESPSGVTAAAGDAEVSVGWEYPEYGGDPDDLTIGFHVARSEDGGPFDRLTDVPVLRDDASPLQYVDRRARNDATYRYRVTAVDIAGRESEPATSAAVTPRDTTPPAAPTGVSAQVGEAEAQVLWRMSPEPDVAGYFVERSTGLDQPYDRLTQAPVAAGRPRWRDTTAAGATRYFYRVVAVDEAGNESDPSNARVAIPVDRTAPEPPTDLTVEVTQGRQLRIRWDPSPSDDVRGYWVYRGEDSAQVARIVERPVQSTEHADPGFAGRGLVPGRRYLVRVAAVDRADNRSEAVEATVRIPDDEAPEAPRALYADNLHGRYVRLEWAGSPSFDVAAYEVRRVTGNETPVTIARVAADAERRARDTTVVRGRTYVYRAVALDSAGNESPAAVDTMAFGDFTPPPAPRFTAAAAVDQGVRVRWERVVDDELAGYHVYRSGLPTGRYERITDRPVSSLEYTDPTGAARHYYVVRAVDTSGNESRASDPVSAGAP
ncbi:MAG: fibronectin type III domain-containing protein [Gemmatimonadota bacterium]